MEGKKITIVVKPSNIAQEKLCYIYEREMILSWNTFMKYMYVVHMCIIYICMCIYVLFKQN